MNLLDFLILIPVVWGCIRGFSKGLIIELATLIGMGLGIVAAYYFSPDLSKFLGEYFSFGSQTLKIISSILIFIAVMLVAWLIGKAIEKVVDMIALGWLNKILGAIIGLLKGALIAGLLLFLVVYFDKDEKLITRKAKEKSMFYQGAAKIVPGLLPNTKMIKAKQTVCFTRVYLLRRIVIPTGEQNVYKMSTKCPLNVHLMST